MVGNGRIWGGALLAAVLVFGCRSTAPPTPPYEFTRAEDVVRAMHDRYFNRWGAHAGACPAHHAGGITQRSASGFCRGQATRPAAHFEPRDQGNGLLLVADTQYVVSAGRPTQVRRSIQPLLLLQHDVYYRNPLETMRRLSELGVNLDRVRMDRWAGRSVFVIGALARDSRSRQFWIDRELMLLVRWIEPARDPQQAVETRLLDYERLGSAWVARRMDVLVGGERVARYETRQVRANITLDTLFFSPDNWSRVQHWYQDPVLRKVR